MSELNKIISGKIALLSVGDYIYCKLMDKSQTCEIELRETIIEINDDYIITKSSSNVSRYMINKRSIQYNEKSNTLFYTSWETI